MAIPPISHDFFSHWGKENNAELEGFGENNSLKRLVEWIRADRPGYQKALVYTAIAVASLVLIISVAGIPILGQMIHENRKLMRDAEVIAGDSKIFHAIGGENRYWQLPLFSIGNISADSISEIEPHRMSHSMMRAEDKYKRPCLLLKLGDRQDGSQFIQILHRKYTYEKDWDYHRGIKTVFTGYGLDSQAVKTLNEIVHGNHSRYHLL